MVDISTGKCYSRAYQKYTAREQLYVVCKGEKEYEKDPCYGPGTDYGADRGLAAVRLRTGI